MATQIEFMPWAAPDGQLVRVPPEVLGKHETVEFGYGWLHVRLEGSWTSTRLRSYPAHTIAAVHEGQGKPPERRP